MVQSKDFKHYLPVGKPEIAIEYLNNWGIDEIILLDIDATRNQQRPNFDLIKSCAYHCQVPLTVGGGIQSLVDIEQLLLAGADKVSVNSLIIHKPKIIKQAAQVFGNQCLVASIDVKENSYGDYRVLYDKGTKDSGFEIVDFVQRIEKLEMGEIFLNATHRDGSKQGYDHNLLKKVVANTQLPVIACGGVGHNDHFFSAHMTGVAALAAANFWHYTEQSVRHTKKYLHTLGCPMRIDTFSCDIKTGSVSENPKTIKMAQELV